MEKEIKGEIKFLTIKEAEGEKYRTGEKIFELMQAEAQIDRECAWVLHLDIRLRIIEKELVSMGSIDYSILNPRQVYRKAIINNSSKIIIIHNHPSGDTTPSEEDIEISLQLKKASEILAITLLDFIIIGGNSYFSFVDKHIGGF